MTMDKIKAMETIGRLNKERFVAAGEVGAFEREVERDISKQLEAYLGYPAPFRIRLVLDRDDIGKITDVEITPTQATVAKMHPAFVGQIRDDIARALKSISTIYMTGIYTGEDGSMGFRRGQTYRFAITKAQGKCREIAIRTEEGLLRCRYSSVDALLRYWRPLYMWNSERDNGVLFRGRGQTVSKRRNANGKG